MRRRRRTHKTVTKDNIQACTALPRTEIREIAGYNDRSPMESSRANSRAAIRKRTSNKKSRKSKKKREGAWKDLGRWKPTDDLALATAVQQTNDLVAVFQGVKFSCHFTLREIQERWYALLYEPVLSRTAVQAVRNLHPELVLAIQRRTLFSKQEQDVLSTVPAGTSPPPTLADFSGLLLKNPHVFHPARTARSLFQHWQALRQYSLLPDQAVQPLPQDGAGAGRVQLFGDVEAAIDVEELHEERDELLDRELAAADRKLKKQIRFLEAEVSKWQFLVGQVRGDTLPEFDERTLAVIRGRLVRYLMRSKEITLGRATKDNTVDVDLKLEGPAWKISRRQGIIKLNNTGEFFVANEGRRSIFVDGKPILRGDKGRLCNNSVLEIGGLKFVFLINHDLVEAVRSTLPSWAFARPLPH